MTRAELLLIPFSFCVLAACGDKSEDEDEDDAAVYSGPCPQVSLGSAVGDGIATGSTRGADNDWGRCGSAPDSVEDSGWGGAPDVSLAWVAPSSGTYTGYTRGSRFDTLLTLIEGGCSGEVLACNDDGGEDLDSAITFAATAGQTYVFIIDGYDAGEDGDWEFSITEGGRPWGSDSGDYDWDESAEPERMAAKRIGAGPPEVQTVFGPSGVDVNIRGGAGGWLLGVARTADLTDPYAFLADCHTGAQVAGSWQSACQPLERATTHLSYGGDPMALAPGSSLLRADDAGSVTWLLESDPDQGGDGRCYVWGHDPTAFSTLRCLEL